MLPPGYEIRAVRADDIDTMRPIVELDGALSDGQWAAFAERVLPDGLLAACEVRTAEPIGTIAAVHSPRGARFYFPGGGQIGYLVVSPPHRGHRIGFALVAAALARLHTAGYRTIWLGVQDHRTAAIRTYVNAGFVPFLHPPDPDALAERWRAVFGDFSDAPREGLWRHDLDGIG